MGDACEKDQDGDGVPDDDDVCPRVKHLSRTSFLDYFTVDLYSGHADPVPEWHVGTQVRHARDAIHVTSDRLWAEFPSCAEVVVVSAVFHRALMWST